MSFQDLHAVEIYAPSSEVFCEVAYNHRNCSYAYLDVDNTNGGDMGAETLTVTEGGSFVYTIYVVWFEDGTPGTPPMTESGASLKMYR